MIPIETRDKQTPSSANSLLKETRGYESKPNNSTRANGSALFSTVFSLRLNTRSYGKRTQHSNLWQEQLAEASQLTADAHRLRLLGERRRRAGGLMPPVEWSGMPRKYWLREKRIFVCFNGGPQKKVYVISFHILAKHSFESQEM